MIKKINKENFNNICKIKITNIMQGLYDYKNETHTFLSINSAYKFIQDLFKENGDVAIIDFHMDRLDSSSATALLQSISNPNKQSIQEILEYLHQKEILYFSVDSFEELKGIIESNYYGLFFCNIYLTNINITLWPSFNGDIIKFSNN